MPTPFCPRTFAAPPARLRGAPFWSWNGRLDRGRLLRQLGVFADMGFGGVTIHCRTGLATPYLGPEFLDHVAACVDRARQRGMHVWLYDEDRWPSGFGGGRVAEDPELRLRWLLLTRRPYADAEQAGREDMENISHGGGQRIGGGTLLARYRVELDADGCLLGHRRLAADEVPEPGGELWYAYAERARPTPWFNHGTYIDTLNPLAARAFLAASHEVYAGRVGAAFGSVIPAFFTDEPQHARKGQLACARGAGDLVLPWTGDLPASFAAAHGADLLARLPEALWLGPGRTPAPLRWRLHEHLAERFASGFADVLGAWCAERGLALTGHVMGEPTMAEQSMFVGEAMRSYRAFAIPGIDILCDRVELVTAKQCQSAKHQFGREDMLSELYGVTDWDFRLCDHKRQGDWQAALGVTVRVHHLAWYSMAGEAKRDYPASISGHVAWHRDYRMVEDHFARLATALSAGRPAARVAVIHPIESFWLLSGPAEHTAAAAAEADARLRDLVAGLAHGLIDFDLVAESLLPGLHRPDADGFAVGAMAYAVVVLPALITLRRSTCTALAGFLDRGGRVIALGALPTLLDGAADADGTLAALLARCERREWSPAGLLAALEPLREVAVDDASLVPCGHLLHQLRHDGDERILMVCNPHPVHGDGPWAAKTVRIRGSWQVERLDTGDGSSAPLAAEVVDGWTRFGAELHPGAHCLVRCRPGRPAAPAAGPAPWQVVATIADGSPFTLHEPNVLLLDRARWRFTPTGGTPGEWQAADDILRIDERLRALAGLPPRTGSDAQPWADRRPDPVAGRIELRFAFAAEVACAGVRLVVERPETWRIALDGCPVSALADGWYVDEDLRTVPLPEIGIGRHELELAGEMRRSADLEWCLLAGAFAVRPGLPESVLAVLPERLHWGDWGMQGLPHYGGAVTYHARCQGGGRRWLHLPLPGAICARVLVDGVDRGLVWHAPWRIDLGELAPGEHRLDLVVHGSRRNAFGCVHRVDRGAADAWIGPEAWRTSGQAWSQGPLLRPQGVWCPPQLLARG